MWSAGRMTERRSDTGKRSMVITRVPWGEDDLIESRLLAALFEKVVLLRTNLSVTNHLNEGNLSGPASW